MLYRDDDVLILDKPGGLPVHYGCKVQIHLEQFLDAVAFDRSEPPKLAHRLDKDTSGCLVLGRHGQALTLLGRLFMGHRIEKVYWAVVEGIPAESCGRIDLPLLKLAGENGARMKVHPKGKKAVTDYRILAEDGRKAWLELRPHTGRTHQLRAHCAALGTPILGDATYGHDRAPAQPLHLHARAIRLPWPGRPIAAEAPLPAAMAATFAACNFNWREKESGNP